MPDLHALRDDPAAFADEASPVELTDWQREELRAAPGSPISTWLWGRQLSKSLLLALLGLWVCFKRSDQLVLLASGGGELGSKRVMADVRRIAAASPWLAGSVADESSLVFSTSNGSIIRALPLTEESGRGWRAHAVLADEAQALPGWAMSSLLPTMAAQEDGFMVLAGTAGRAEGPFYDLCRQGEVGADHIRFSRRVSRLVGGPDLAPWQSPTMTEATIAALGPTRSDAELRCLWQSGSDRLFTLRDWEVSSADYMPDRLDSMQPPAGCWAGLDLAVSATGDRSAFIGLSRLVLPDAPTIIGVRCAHKWEPGYPLIGMGDSAAVFEEVAQSPAVFEAIRVDKTGMQSGFLQYLWPLLRSRSDSLGGGRPASRAVVIDEGVIGPRPVRWRQTVPRAGVQSTDVAGLDFTPAFKSAAFGSMRALVQRGSLVFPSSATELRAEFLNLSVGLSRSGLETFEGSSDDLMDALALSLRPYRRPNGEWRTVAGDVADGQAVPVEIPAGLWTPGRVLTGGGLEIPTSPTWASMLDAAVTPPLGPTAPTRYERLREQAREALQRQQEATT